MLRRHLLTLTGTINYSGATKYGYQRNPRNVIMTLLFSVSTEKDSFRSCIQPGFYPLGGGGGAGGKLPPPNIFIRFGKTLLSNSHTLAINFLSAINKIQSSQNMIIISLLYIKFSAYL